MRSLAVKLSLAFLLVGITGILLIALFVNLRTQREFDRFVVDRYQADLVTNLQTYYAQNGSWTGVEALFGQRRRSTSFGAIPATLLDSTRRVIASRHYTLGQQLAQPDTNRDVPLVVDGETIGWLHFDPPPVRPILSNSPEAEFLGRMREAILYGALGSVAVALVLGVLLARTLLRPVRELKRATQALARGELGHQVTIRARDELGELGAAFNQMSTELARSVHLRRQMTADIAHDLRTPLSVILGYTEALTDGKFQGSPDVYAILYDEAQHLNRLIDDLRTLSLADAGELPMRREQVAPSDLLERAAAAHRIQAEKNGIRLSVEAAPNLPVLDADPERMAQVLDNLVSNAMRYTPEGGQIRLAATTDGDAVALRVQDDGAGIAPEDLSYIFERFYRGDKARRQTGESGLGLPIAKSLVEMHGGTLSVHSTPGQGTTFTIALPAT